MINRLQKSVIVRALLSIEEDQVFKRLIRVLLYSANIYYSIPTQPRYDTLLFMIKSENVNYKYTNVDAIFYINGLNFRHVHHIYFENQRSTGSQGGGGGLGLGGGGTPYVKVYV